jgi:hypothetical protein
MAKTMVLAVGLWALGGCLTRAPTTYELDRRAGFTPPNGGTPRREELSPLHTSSAVARAPRVPVKVPPLIEKVWLSDLALGPRARLQGTWVYLEVEPGRWLDEIDPGGAPLLDLEAKKGSRGAGRDVPHVELEQPLP